jgi:hypothetical protein
MIAYVSGKYTTGDIPSNIAHARRIAIKLWELGYAVFCPHLNTSHFELDCKATYDDFIKGDLEIVERCDLIVMLSGWKDSPGAIRERQTALEVGIPIYYEPFLPENIRG